MDEPILTAREIFDAVDEIVEAAHKDFDFNLLKTPADKHFILEKERNAIIRGARAVVFALGLGDLYVDAPVRSAERIE